METWSEVRVKRSKDQGIRCDDVISTDAGWICSVIGVTDCYIIEIDDEWPPRCNCEDSYWRADVLCKHIMHILLMLGIDENRVMDIDYHPTKDEQYIMKTALRRRGS